MNLDYIAGLMDADGSFNISISKNRYVNKKGTSEPQFSFVCNFRQLERARDVLEEIQKVFGAGKIYNHSHAGSQKMLTWQTTSAFETLEVCNQLLPYLRVKRNDCQLLIKALNLWLNSPRESHGGRPGVGPVIKQQIADISSQMNLSQQKETSCRNKEIRRFNAPELIGFSEEGDALYGDLIEIK